MFDKLEYSLSRNTLNCETAITNRHAHKNDRLVNEK